MQHEDLTVGGWALSRYHPLAQLFGPVDESWMGKHRHPGWFISPQLFVLMFTSSSKYMLEPALLDAINDKDLLERMVTNNVYVARMNQTNLHLGPNALSHRDIVKQNNQQVEDVVHIVSLKLLTNNTFQPHHLLKTFFHLPLMTLKKRLTRTYSGFTWG